MVVVKVETSSTVERWLRRIGEGPWSALCPTLRARPDEAMQLIERKLERMERSVKNMQVAFDFKEISFFGNTAVETKMTKVIVLSEGR